MYSEEIILTIAGTKFTGWKQASITKSIEACSGSFSCTIVPLNEVQFASLVPGAPCVVSIGEDKLITGYLDSVSPSGDLDSGFQLTVEGRDKTGDLVDCSVERAPYTWKNLSLYAFAKVICAPFDITVSHSGSFEDPKEDFDLEIGESPFEALSKAAKSRSVLLIPDAQGNLFIGSPGVERLHDSLVLGKNIRTFNAEYNGIDRFHKYVVKGQKSGQGSVWGTSKNTNIHAAAIDEEIRSPRVKIFSADSAETNSIARARASWEATSRAAQAERMTVSVSGFRQSNGDLWRMNYRVPILIDTNFFYIKTEMLVSSISYTLNEDGRVTALTLKRKDVYTGLKKIKKKKQGQGIVWK